MNDYYYFKVDKVLKEDCDVQGEFCQFHFWLIDKIKQMKSEVWFQEFKQLFQRTKKVWDQKKKSYVDAKFDGYPKPTNIYMKRIFLSVIHELDLQSSLDTNVSTIDSFKNKMDSLDYFNVFENIQDSSRRRKRQTGKHLNTKMNSFLDIDTEKVSPSKIKRSSDDYYDYNYDYNYYDYDYYDFINESYSGEFDHTG